MDVVRSPTLSSLTPVTVTLCSVFQLVVVKVRVAADTVATLASSLVTVTVTSAVGWAARSTL